MTMQAEAPEGALDSPSGASRWGGHEPLPSVVSQYDGLSAQHLGRGVAPGGYDTCYPGCPDCVAKVEHLRADAGDPWDPEQATDDDAEIVSRMTTDGPEAAGMEGLT